MDDKQTELDNLKQTIALGFSLQSILATITFAVTENDEIFISKLGELLKNYKENLTPEKQKELEDFINQHLASKADEIVDELEDKMSEDEVNEVLNSLGNTKQ